MPRWHSWIMDPIHEKGLKFLFHTDGQYGAALPIVFETLGADGLHPVERNGCNDIFDIHARYPSKLLFGNVCCEVTLPQGNTFDVEDETVGAPGEARTGNVVFSSGLPAKSTELIPVENTETLYGDSPRVRNLPHRRGAHPDAEKGHSRQGEDPGRAPADEDQGMTPRERVRMAIHHQEPDHVPLDLGSTLVTGIHVSAYKRLRAALGVSGGIPRVYDPFQMLGVVEEPVKKALGVDTFGIELPTTIFGYRNDNWKRFTLFDGTEVEISGHFEYDVLPSGDIVQYPKGDRSAPPSGRMPTGGFYFDSIVRQEPIDEAKLDPKEWVAQSYSLYTEEELRFLEETSRRWFESSNYSLIGNFWGAGFGDIALVPGPAVAHPKGIRDPEEWYVSSITRKDYVQEIFRLQLELQMKNLQMYRQAVGDRIDVVVISGTDFGYRTDRSSRRRRIERCSSPCTGR